VRCYADAVCHICYSLCLSVTSRYREKQAHFWHRGYPQPIYTVL